MADNSARIAEIQEILRAGATSVSVDGVTTTYNFNELRKELRDLQQSDDSQKRKRPVASNIYLGGF